MKWGIQVEKSGLDEYIDIAGKPKLVKSDKQNIQCRLSRSEAIG
jgi:hypothetical protein